MIHGGTEMPRPYHETFQAPDLSRQRIPWRFFDPKDLSVFSFPVNPHTDSTNFAGVSRVDYSIQNEQGRTIISSPGWEPTKASFRGILYTQAQVFGFALWFEKDYWILLEDDLGYAHKVMLESFELETVRSSKYLEKVEYSFTAVLLP